MMHREGSYALVLLSGGMDSTAALHWAMGHGYKEVRALGYAWGQPNRDREMALAGRVAARIGVTYEGRAIADAMRVTRPMGLLDAVTDDAEIRGAHPAFVPGRNVIFLSLAAAEGATFWRSGYFDIIIGANADDAAGFPDCRAGFFDAFSTVLRQAYAREFRIVAPWVGLSKGGILATFHDNPAALADIQRSWSCYRGDAVPCGKCTPCVLRAGAFARANLPDLSVAVTMSGGDPGRSAGVA